MHVKMTNFNDPYLQNDLQPQAETFRRLKSQHEVLFRVQLKVICEVQKRVENWGGSLYRNFYIVTKMLFIIYLFIK